MSILEVKNVSIRYMTGDFKEIGLKEYVMRRVKGDYHVQEFWADKNISFSLEKGDMLGIIGTNGAGKSTLLKAISGIMEPTRGRVKREGNIAALLELGSGFDGDLTVRENTYLRGAMLGYTRKFMDDTYQQIIDFAELREFQDRPFKQLSSGMKSRLAFSIASLVKPDILILDEVLSVGDGAFRKKSEAKMREIISGGATTILVSHSLDQVRKMCNKVLWLHKGEQVEFGNDVQGICDKYQKFLENEGPGGTPKKGIASVEPYFGQANQIKQSKRGQVCKYAGLYTSLFVFTFLLAYSPFLLEGKSFIWTGDGRTQHYPALVYIGRYLRQIILNILHGDWSIPLFDMNIGLGSDVIATLNYYGFGDPLYLLSVFVPTKYIEYLYNFLAIFRLYLAGLSFSLLCRYQKKRPPFILAGALIYVFSGYAIFSAVRHPYFINPMIQLPLLIIGIDKVIQRKKSYLFIFAVFYSALCGFYFLYMMTIMLGIYTLVRFFEVVSKNRVKDFVQMAGRVIGNYLLGIGMSAMLFVPAVIGFLYSSRSGQTIARDFFSYGWNYYRNNLLRLIGANGSWDALSIAAVSLFALVLLFSMRGRRYWTLKLLLAAGAVIYVLPLGGYIMNGFGYPSQRWTFGLVLLISYVVTEIMPTLLSLSYRQKIVCFAVLFIYMMCIFSSSKTRNAYYVVGVAMLAITLVVLLLFGDEAVRGIARNTGAIACILLIISNVSVNAIYRFAKDQVNYINSFTPYGSETERLETAPVREAESYLNKYSGRFDSSSSFHNTGMVWRVPTSSIYWSNINANIADYWIDTENIQQSFTFNIYGTDQRTIMSTLLSTRYYIENENRTQYIPYGYTLIDQTKDQRQIYENEYNLPWGYTYDSYISYEELAQMNGLEQEECMLQNIALHTELNSIPKGAPASAIHEIAYAIQKETNLKWKDGILKVEKDNASLNLDFQMPEGTEGYLRLQGFDINNSGQSSFNVTVRSENISKSATARSTADNWYFGRENYLHNLGYSQEERTSCTITFPKKGTYRLEAIELFALPMDKYPEQVEALRAEPLENIQFGTNRVTGTVNLSKNKILCMSIPYSKGWSAKVDGEPAEILRGNIMFMALPLKEGYHEVEFTYCTPGLRAGAAISVISFSILSLHIFLDRKKREFKR